jgi:hypothetical protein
MDWITPREVAERRTATPFDLSGRTMLPLDRPKKKRRPSTRFLAAPNGDEPKRTITSSPTLGM